jgi:hypothetical protein
LSPILTLELFYNQGSLNEWTSLHESSSLTFFVENLLPGEFYEFKYRAFNIFGYSEFSSATTIQAACEPEQIDQISFTIVNSDLRVEWSAPYDKGSAL